MNIVMFCDAYYPEITGVVVSIHSFSKQMVEKGHKVLIVCPDYSRDTTVQLHRKPYIQSYDDPRIQVMRVVSHKLWFAPDQRDTKKNQRRNIKKIIDEFKPDIVHVHTEFVIGQYGFKYAKRAHIPMVYTFHTMWEDYLPNYIPFFPKFISRMIGRYLIKKFLKNASQVICPTKRIEEVARKYKYKGETRIIPTGIAPDLLDLREKLTDSDDVEFFENHPELKGKKVLLYVGRLAAEKNIYFLFDVLSKVLKNASDTVLAIVGKGPELNSLMRKAKTYDCSDSIIFEGEKSGKELGLFYKNASVFVFPSMTETQGLVTIESMSFSLPAVAIGILGTKDVMQGDNGGFMVNNDLEEFSAKVLQLLTDENLRKQKSKEALQWSQNWSIEKLCTSMLEAYENAEVKIKNK